MSSFSALARALSPGVSVLEHASDDAVRVKRQHLILSCNTVDEVVSLIPIDYRSICAEHLTRLAATAERLAKTRATVASWKHHKSVGTLPPNLRTVAAQVQFTAGYGDSAAAKAAQKALNDAHLEYQRTTLTSMIAAREKEVEALELETSPDHAADPMFAAVMAASPKIVARYKVPVEFDRPAAAGDSNDETMRDVRWEQSPAAKALGEEVLTDCPVYTQRVITIQLNRADQLSRKIEKKRAVAAAATTAANDGAGGTAPSTMTTAIQAEVKRIVMGLMPREPKSKKKTKAEKAKVSASQSRYHCIAEYFTGSSASSPSQNHGAEWEFQVPHVPTLLPTQANSRRQQETEAWLEGAGWEGSRLQLRQESAGGFEQGREVAATSEASEVEGEKEEEWTIVARSSTDTSAAVGHIVERIARMTRARMQGANPPLIALGDMWLSQPKTIPDFLLTLPIPTTVNIILSNTSLSYLEELSFQQYVHLSPGVTVPRDIAFQLSIGAKYMFHQPTNAKLITESWQDFNRRLRWRLHFLITEEGNNEPYDPDYDVRPPSDKAAPSLPHYIELGLVAGRRYVNSAFVKARDAKDEGQFVYTPNVRAVREFLTSNDYVVTGTDKNLGLAVSRKDWIIQKCQDCLNNVNDYRRLLPGEASNILSAKCKQMEELASFSYEHCNYGKQLSEFLRSRITPRKTTHHIPTFYGIPKIHKVPTKMRPIIPCHSAIMNLAAKVVSKRLKPIVESAPTVIHGTKDLAQKLSKLNIDTTRKWYIVTGDVVAFYPNIPLEKCLNVVKELHFEHYFAGQAQPYSRYNTDQQKFFSDCCDIGNTHLITQFNGQIYEQLNGLAMGVADSPDLANLWGHYFERKARVLQHPNIFYYGRYIDDCIAIVYAENNLEAINLLSNLIQFDNCVIEWSPASDSQPFLDMLLYKDNHNTLQYMPYRKAGNHQERIPWISAHPLDVKRGTFLGEMSRLAVLSSTMETYTEALKDLIKLYIHRGYPADLVHKWYYSNIQVRWNKKLENRPVPTADTLVLKTEYNLAWNYFNAHTLGQTIFDYWSEWLQRHETGSHNMLYPAPAQVKGTSQEVFDIRETNIMNSRVILSRKRTRNLLDLTNLWKKSVLESLERDVLGEIAQEVRVAVARPTNALDYDVNTSVVGPRPIKRSGAAITYEDSDEEMNIHRRSPEPRTSDAWRSGATNQWGRGSRP